MRPSITTSYGFAIGAADAASPAAAAGFVAPSPVQKTARYSPAFAGCCAVTSVKSEACATTGAVYPSAVVKIPGAAPITPTDHGALLRAPRWITIDAPPCGRLYGAWKLICPAETYSSGAAVSPT